jgi:hypothetical protein
LFVQLQGWATAAFVQNRWYGVEPSLVFVSLKPRMAGAVASFVIKHCGMVSRRGICLFSWMAGAGRSFHFVSSKPWMAGLLQFHFVQLRMH